VGLILSRDADAVSGVAAGTGELTARRNAVLTSHVVSKYSNLGGSVISVTGFWGESRSYESLMNSLLNQAEIRPPLRESDGVKYIKGPCGFASSAMRLLSALR
jgi:hypothetical protein